MHLLLVFVHLLVLQQPLLNLPGHAQFEVVDDRPGARPSEMEAFYYFVQYVLFGVVPLALYVGDL